MVKLCITRIDNMQCVVHASKRKFSHKPFLPSIISMHTCKSCPIHVAVLYFVINETKRKATRQVTLGHFYNMAGDDTMLVSCNTLATRLTTLSIYFVASARATLSRCRLRRLQLDSALGRSGRDGSSSSTIHCGVIGR